ncbi:MAG: GNAT family N-acetyltransferase [Parcubacteria group bacterium]
MISLRKINFYDIELLWHLRNQPDVYKYFRQNRRVSWEKHIKWIMPIILGMAKKDFFMIQHESLPIGQIRFDYQKNKEAKVSIAILKEFRGRGISRESFKKAVKLVKKEKKLKTIIAEVHKNNIPSQRFFEKLNFKLKEKKGNWLKYTQHF